MPRPLWKGNISFGLVSIPVVLYTAENKSNVQFHMVDRQDKSRIHYSRISDKTGKEVPWDRIAKGYTYADEKILIVDEAELKKIAGENLKTIAIETFVTKESIPATFFEKPYYLAPDKKGEKGYVILRDTLKASKKIGIAKVIIHTREYLAALLPHENAIILNVLRYDQNLRKPKDYDLPDKDHQALKITKKEMAIAKQLLDSMTNKWQPQTFKDDYQETLEKWIADKVAKQPQQKMKKRSKLSTAAKASDFVRLLRDSLKKNKKNNPQVAKSSRTVARKTPAHKASYSRH